MVPAYTTDNIMIFASDGRFFTLACDKLPPGRGHGEPLKLMIDVDEGAKIVAVFPHVPGRRRLLASKAGYGFLMPEQEAVAFRRAGKQVLNVEPGGAVVCLEAAGDHVLTVGDNGKALIFPLGELPEMARGKGVKLQAFKTGALKDAAIFDAAGGPAWIDGSGKRRDWKEWRDWLGKRAGAGKVTPRGFRRLIDEGGIGLAQIDLTRCGLTAALEIAAYAAARGIPVANHNFTTDINTAASLHFLAAVPNALVLEYCVEPSEISRALARDPFRLEDGHFRVPDAPGLGVEPDMAVVEHFLVKG